MLALAAALASGAAGSARAATADRPPERWIWAVNNAGEEVALAYRTGDIHEEAAMARLRHLFRDLRENQPGPLPPLLVDMLSLLQEQWNYERPLRIHSGFRTPRTNAGLEGAAPASLHLSGLAADISVRGHSAWDLTSRALALSHRLGFMGIGIYSNFVHVDLGRSRAWTRLTR